MPVVVLNDQAFEDGIELDASGIPGWGNSETTDLLLMPLPETAFVDPFASIPTLNLICSLQDPITLDDFVLDPRAVAKRALAYLAASGNMDRCLFVIEPEYYLFGPEGDDGKLGPAELSANSLAALQSCGIVATLKPTFAKGEQQVVLSLPASELMQAADQLMIAKYVIKEGAKRMGHEATFMPKPLQDNFGSGMHVYMNLLKGNEPVLSGIGYGGLNDWGLGAIGGILRHANALLAFTNPSTNSYRRLVECFDAPMYLTYSQRVRGTAVRVPERGNAGRNMPLEIRCPDGSANPYLALSGLLMAAMDGIHNKIAPGEPLDMPLRALPLEVRRTLPQTPASLEVALSALEINHDFLLRGDVFSAELIECWIDSKRELEVEMVRRAPHPVEFELYRDS